LTRSDLEKSFRCWPLDRQRGTREAKISSTHVDVEKHFRGVDTVEIFDFRHVCLSGGLSPNILGRGSGNTGANRLQLFGNARAGAVV
jgi:hypothetical protein